MSKLKITALIAVLLVGLLLASQALAMSSANFRLDWFTPMTGGGGGPVGSTHFAASFTVGQTVIGNSASPNVRSGMGYWYGVVSSIIQNFRFYLPQVMKN
jgi:hypothetical protein